MFNNIFYYLTLGGMMMYSVIDYCNGKIDRVCLWLTISAVMIVAHEIANSQKPVIYENCNFIQTTPEDKEK